LSFFFFFPRVFLFFCVVLGWWVSFLQMVIRVPFFPSPQILSRSSAFLLASLLFGFLNPPLVFSHLICQEPVLLRSFLSSPSCFLKKRVSHYPPPLSNWPVPHFISVLRPYPKGTPTPFPPSLHCFFLLPCLRCMDHLTMDNVLLSYRFFSLPRAFGVYGNFLVAFFERNFETQRSQPPPLSGPFKALNLSLFQLFFSFCVIGVERTTPPPPPKTNPPPPTPPPEFFFT